MVTGQVDTRRARLGAELRAVSATPGGISRLAQSGLLDKAGRISPVTRLLLVARPDSPLRKHLPATLPRLPAAAGLFTPASTAPTRVPLPHLLAIYRAKCEDLNVPDTADREARFLEVARRQCDGPYFRMPESGLGPASAVAIAALVADDGGLVGLDLSCNRVKTEGALALAAAVPLSTSLVVLSLRSNGLDDDGMAAILAAVAQSTTVTRLDLSASAGVNRNRAGPKSLAALAFLLSGKPPPAAAGPDPPNPAADPPPGAPAAAPPPARSSVLATLGFSSVSVGPSGSLELVEALRVARTLTELDLSSNALGPEGSAVACGAITSAGALAVLSLARNKVGDEGCEAVSGMLARLPSLTSLDIADNGIGPEGARAVSDGLVFLQHLDLSGNPIESAGCAAIAGSVGSWHLRPRPGARAMRSLAMARCEIGAEGAAALGEALKVATSLTRVDVSGNPLADEGVAALASRLGPQTALESLDLAGVRCADGGGAALAAMLSRSSTLWRLNLSDNKITEVTGQALCRVLAETNHSLRVLDLGFPDIRYSTSADLAQRVARNASNFRASEPVRLKREVEELTVTLAQRAVRQKELNDERELTRLALQAVDDKKARFVNYKKQAQISLQSLQRDSLAARAEVEEMDRKDSAAAARNHATRHALESEYTRMEAHFMHEIETTKKVRREEAGAARKILDLEAENKAHLAALREKLIDAISERDWAKQQEELAISAFVKAGGSVKKIDKAIHKKAKKKAKREQKERERMEREKIQELEQNGDGAMLEDLGEDEENAVQDGDGEVFEDLVEEEGKTEFE